MVRGTHCSTSKVIVSGLSFVKKQKQKRVSRILRCVGFITKVKILMNPREHAEKVLFRTNAGTSFISLPEVSLCVVTCQGHCTFTGSVHCVSPGFLVVVVVGLLCLHSAATKED